MTWPTTRPTKDLTPFLLRCLVGCLVGTFAGSLAAAWVHPKCGIQHRGKGKVLILRKTRSMTCSLKKNVNLKKQEGSQRRRQGPQQRQEQSRRKLVGEHVKGCAGLTEMTLHPFLLESAAR